MTPRDTTSASRLRHALDRSVALARVIEVAGCAGRIACAFAAAWGLALLVRRGLAGSDEPTVPPVWAGLFATVVAGAVAWFAIRRTISSWPTRLRQALATEQAHPHLGETISRAVEFLDGVTAAEQGRPATDPTGSPALKRLAVAQAADALAGVATPPLPDASRHLGFAAAGAIAIAALLVPATPTRSSPPAGTRFGSAAQAAVSATAATMDVWGQIEVLRARLGAGGTPAEPKQVASAVAALANNARRLLAAATGTSGRVVLTAFVEGLSPLPGMAQDARGVDAVRATLDRLSALAHASARIADAASFERRLADVLGERFQAAPGVAAIALPPRARSLLRQIAELHEGCRRGVATDLQALAATAQKGDSASDVGRACALAAPVVESAVSSEDIRANRLARASRSALESADILAAAADILGVNGTDPAGPIAFGLREPPSSTRLASERLDALVDLINRDAGGDRTADMAHSAATGKRGPGPEAGTATGAVTSPAPGASASSATGALREVTNVPAGGDLLDRIWMLLPEQSVPLRPQADDLRAFPSHQAAIDAYYRLLFESLKP